MRTGRASHFTSELATYATCTCTFLLVLAHCPCNNSTRVVPWPALPDCTVDVCIGQAVFADFDLDGKLDLLLPACFDPKCANSSLLQVGLEKLWNWEETKDIWAVMSLELGTFRSVVAPFQGHGM